MAYASFTTRRKADGFCSRPSGSSRRMRSRPKSSSAARASSRSASSSTISRSATRRRGRKFSRTSARCCAAWPTKNSWSCDNNLRKFRLVLPGHGRSPRSRNPRSLPVVMDSGPRRRRVSAGMRSRAQVVRVAGSISAAAAARPWHSPAMPAPPTRCVTLRPTMRGSQSLRRCKPMPPTPIGACDARRSREIYRARRDAASDIWSVMPHVLSYLPA